MQKGIIYRIRKMLLRPLWKMRDFIYTPIRKRIEAGYRPASYWKKRHRKYGFDIRGVGNCALSESENDTSYKQARDVFLELCKQLNVDFAKIKILDIGCGSGFYANIIESQGGKDYTGVDITDILFNQLGQRFPGFHFRKLDITKERVEGQFDLVFMIDVTQHIVDNELFSFAMQNINSCLHEDGIFIVTSNLSESFRQLNMHVVERTMDFYKREFPNAIFSNPVPFRDKYIFSIKKHLPESIDQFNAD